MKCSRAPIGLVTLGVLVSGCLGRIDPAHFEGSSEPRRAEPEAVVELAARDTSLEVLGHVHASCTAKPGFHRLSGEPLSDVDCSPERLDFALREAAASAGGEALIGVRCSTRRLWNRSSETHRIGCAADVARYSGERFASERPLSVPRSFPPSRPAPSPSEVKRIDEPDATLSFRIGVDFEPSVEHYEHSARAFGEVRELSSMPLVDHSLGELTTSCEDGCDERALRRGVLIAAGRLGAPDVVAVRCYRRGDGNACMGTVAAPEFDE